MTSENQKNGEKKTLTDDECFKEYVKEFQLKTHIAVNIEMVKEGLKTKESAFNSIKKHYEDAGFR